MEKKKQVTLIVYSFTPSDMNFLTFLLPKVNLAKKNSQKIYSLRPFLSKVYFSFKVHKIELRMIKLQNTIVENVDFQWFELSGWQIFSNQRTESADFRQWNVGYYKTSLFQKIPKTSIELSARFLYATAHSIQYVSLILTLHSATFAIICKNNEKWSHELTEGNAM